MDNKENNENIIEKNEQGKEKEEKEDNKENKKIEESEKNKENEEIKKSNEKEEQKENEEIKGENEEIKEEKEEIKEEKEEKGEKGEKEKYKEIIENEEKQDIETKKTLGIDINKINEGTRKNFIYDFQEINLRKSSNSNSNESEEENSIENNSMIQKSPLLELDSPTKEFECIFPDFYLIDNIGFLYNKKIRKRRKSVTDTIKLMK